MHLRTKQKLDVQTCNSFTGGTTFIGQIKCVFVFVSVFVSVFVFVFCLCICLCHWWLSLIVRKTWGWFLDTNYPAGSLESKPDNLREPSCTVSPLFTQYPLTNHSVYKYEYKYKYKYKYKYTHKYKDNDINHDRDKDRDNWYQAPWVPHNQR